MDKKPLTAKEKKERKENERRVIKIVKDIYKDGGVVIVQSLTQGAHIAHSVGKESIYTVITDAIISYELDLSVLIAGVGFAQGLRAKKGKKK